MKKKTFAFVICLALALVALVGSTMAYFTDTDDAENVFTAGGVAVDLHEANKDNPPLVDDEYHRWLKDQQLMPGTSKTTSIAKRVYVENTGKSDAYVRVHIAIPAILDSGDPTFDAGSNVLHFNSDPGDMGEGKWNWGKNPGAPAGEYFGEGDTWNYYETTIDNIEYHVYVVTYETALKPEEVTADAIHQVYLYKTVTNEDVERINEQIGTDWKILVFAEGGQVQPFENAYEALNEQFGTPSADNNPWNK